MEDKASQRKLLRKKRRECVEQLPETMRGLVFRHPPAPLLDLIAPDAVIGLYHATADEAPTAHYAGFFFDRGHTIALPRFASRDAPMEFARHSDPYGACDLEPGPFGALQPEADADTLVPDVLFMPLLGFTARGERLGQGGGHYDRWLAEHPAAQTVGLAWDVQLCETLPIEHHDRHLHAIVTPTRLYGPF
ncbi:5-formyltetrahydrofolate cyclo-ligase [Altererythrobacter sp. Z27]|uniref:5-formyltetrahydrofolate cyclo-ligase n=1 Tax=Altererythrobacter sp. Z27 TaxID=3461147 RepID=UPI00404500D8